MVAGTFEQTRDFAYALMRSNRLLNMSQVKWERAQGRDEVRLTMLVVRYINDKAPEEEEEAALLADSISKADAAEGGSKS